MTDNTTLKRIQYLLEDNSRLAEVSIKELTEWEDSLPFYQPLKMLMAKKNEMLGLKNIKSDTATFFSNDIDFDRYEEDHKKIISDDENQKVVTPEEEDQKITTPDVEKSIIDNPIIEAVKDVITTPKKEPSITIDPLPTIEHELASDELEESLIDEILENLDFSSISGHTIIDEYDLNEIKLSESDRDKIALGILSNLKVETIQSSNIIRITPEEEEASEIKEKVKKTKSKKKKKKKKKQIATLSIKSSEEKEDDTDISFTGWLIRTKSIDPNGKKKKSKKKKKDKKTKKKSKLGDKSQKKVIAEANKSIQKDNTIISETLADILASQGHNGEAKEMYKQLSLLFPEKSSYFADKIKNQ